MFNDIIDIPGEMTTYSVSLYIRYSPQLWIANSAIVLQNGHSSFHGKEGDIRIIIRYGK